MRDEHMHGSDFLDVAKHLQMVFQSTSSPRAGSGYTLAGNLTIKGVTQPVTFNTTHNGSQVFPMDQSTSVHALRVQRRRRSAFEVSYGVPMVADEVVLQLEAQFIKPAPTG